MVPDRIAALMETHPLPAISQIILDVMHDLRDPQISTIDLAHKISHDQAISVKLLQVANSPFYGLSRRIGSIQEAVVVLGFDTVRTLVVAIGMLQTKISPAGCAFGRKQFWLHNLLVGLCAKEMARQIQVDHEQAFIGGLLHDIGQMGLLLCAQEKYQPLLEQGLTGDLLVEAEMRDFDFDHAAMGAHMAAHWNFPETIQLAIANHHVCDPAQPDPVADLVYAANWMHEMEQGGCDARTVVEIFPPSLRARLGLADSVLFAGLDEFGSEEATLLLDMLE